MEEIKKENIISILRSQHQALVESASKVLDSVKSEAGGSAANAFNDLSVFKEKLAEHLKFENEVFYVDLIKRMEERGENTRDTKLFIDGMKNIENSINAFFDRYYFEEEIAKNRENFRDDFTGIIEEFKLRAAAEEANLFSYWDSSP